MTILHKHVPFQIKAVEESGQFSGYGSVFGVKDSYGDIVLPGAFDASLAAHKENGTLPAMLWQHRTDQPIGGYTKMAEDDEGLLVEGEILIEAGELEARAHAHMKAGNINGLSIGYSLPADGWAWDKDKQAFLLKEIDLWEVSVVTFPANPEAQIQDVKSLLAKGQKPTLRQFEKFLREAGFSKSEAVGIAADGFGALDTGDGEEGKAIVEALHKLSFQ